MDTNKIREEIERLTNEKYEELRSESRTYGELVRKIREFDKSAAWGQEEILRIVAGKMQRKCEEEMEKNICCPNSARSWEVTGVLSFSLKFD